MTIRDNYPLKNFTTMAIGGPARIFIDFESVAELKEILRFADEYRLPRAIVGEGSNLIPSDEGFSGVVIANRVRLFRRKGPIVSIGAGNNLLETIKKTNRLGLAGLEKMAGIPGTVGGALYGCAGAYGQEIKDHLRKVRFFDGERVRVLSRAECRFGYRKSIFKTHKDWVILDADFRLDPNDPGVLDAISSDILRKRAIKYPPGLRCPGSFFKNIKLDDLKPKERTRLLRQIPQDQVTYGKVAAGVLLERVRAKGMREGSIAVAKHHANLIYNPGGGSASDVLLLAQRLKKLVKNKFGITIQEEVQYLEF